jgi:sulfatase maturation enzyme AslB (radical SAM superfamily)
MLGKYKNGNYSVEIMEDGTKIRRTKNSEFLAEFPECMDVKITDYCDLNCPYCHENSTTNGKHGNILQASFIDTLQPFTELAIGGGNPVSHPDIIPFLQKLKAKDVIANITVNQKHFNQYESLTSFLISENLIKGLGISLTDSSDAIFLEKVSKIKNAVIHVINGLITLKDIKNLSCKSLKILILGYKQFRRGISFYSPEVESNKNMLKKWLPRVAPMFKIVSFDNLALNQLCVKDQMKPEDWSRFYMGDDGMHTMYIDLVKNEFARCSIANIRYPLQNDIISMFDVVKKEK